MVIVMEKHTAESNIERVMSELVTRGFDVHRSTGTEQTVLGVVGDVAKIDTREFELFDGVQEVVRISEPYKLSSRTFRREKTVVKVRGVEIGGTDVVVMAGPCRSKARRSCSRPPAAWRVPARVCCGAARTSRAR